MSSEIWPHLAALRLQIEAVTAGQESQAANRLAHSVDPIFAHLVSREAALSAGLPDFERVVRKAVRAASETADPKSARQIRSALPPDSRTGPAEARHARLLAAVIAALEHLPTDSAARHRLLRTVSVAEHRLRGVFTKAAEEALQALRAVRKADTTLTVEAAQTALEALLPQWVGVRVTDLRTHPALHAKEVHFLRVRGPGGEHLDLVLRRDRPDDPTGRTASAEHPVLQAMYDRGFPVPRVLASTDDPAIAERPLMLMARMPGKPLGAARDFADPAELVSQVVDFMVALHATPVTGSGLPEPPDGDVEALWHERIDTQFRWWHDNVAQPSTAMYRARQWLDDNVAIVSGRPAVVHGDFNLRNMLIGDRGLAAVLDWEFAHVGHPAQDVGFLRQSADGDPSWDGFEALYAERSGTACTREELRYCRIWHLFRQCSVTATIHRRYVEGNFMDATFGAISLTGYPGLLGSLTRLLEEAEGEADQPA